MNLLSLSIQLRRRLTTNLAGHPSHHVPRAATAFFSGVRASEGAAVYSTLRGRTRRHHPQQPRRRDALGRYGGGRRKRLAAHGCPGCCSVFQGQGLSMGHHFSSQQVTSPPCGIRIHLFILHDPSTS